MQNTSEHIQKLEIADQEQRAFDIAMTDRVQAGFTPTKEENASPIDGVLNPEPSEALESLWRANITGAESITGRYANYVRNIPNIDQSDLMQEAHFGLFYSALAWDKLRSDRFFPFAFKNMRSYVKRYIDNEGSTIFLPESAQKRSAIITDTIQRLQEETGVLPDDHDIAYELGITAGKVSLNRTNVGRVTALASLDKPDDDSTAPIDHGEITNLLGDTADSVENQGLRTATIDQIITTLGDESSPLSEIERMVLRLRYLGEYALSVSELASRLGRSNLGIRKIERRAMQKILDSNLAETLRNFH